MSTSGSSTPPSEKSCTWAGAIPSTDTGWAGNDLRAALRRRVWEHRLMKDSACASNECLFIGQPYPGLRQKKCDQQVEKGGPAPLLCAGEASHGVLHPDVKSSRCGILGTGET